MAFLPASFSPDGNDTVTGSGGQRVHHWSLAHSDRLNRKMWKVGDNVWCLVGNGLSNHTFVEGPDGIIVIDSGECTEAMADALVELRQHTQAPIVGMICTHFHYVSGTQAIFDEGADPGIPIWGHAGIVGNLARMSSEVSAAAGRGLVQQFAILMPTDGPDGTVNVGLGNEYRLAEHAPYTNGFVAPTHTIDAPITISLAGLTVELTPAPSDADDNITIWFPDLGVCVNNSVWPVLFNVFAIRGEEYRDPRVLLTGLDHIVGLRAAHLVGVHGPPLSGADQIADDVTAYRDSIQFLWDQTVRGLNRGLSLDELTEFVQLPPRFADRYLTQQLYGLVEHHVRQIYTGLRGWFDGGEEHLFPLPPVERANRLVKGFGGVEVVREQAQAALAGDDVRWALELASWLVRRELDASGRADGGSEADRSLLASVLRTIAQRTTAANVRNWCITRALELDGMLDMSRFRVHRFSVGGVLATDLIAGVHTLRVLLDPMLAENTNLQLRWEFSTGEVGGLRLRSGVAVPTDGGDADIAIALEPIAWAKVLANKLTLSDALSTGAVVPTLGTAAGVQAFFAPFDHRSLTT